MYTTLCCVQERKKLLSFVVVGGGPTGVEVAAELQDMVESDLVKLYPELIQDVRIAVVELQDHLLSTYDRRISEYTREIFTRLAFICHLHQVSVTTLHLHQVSVTTRHLHQVSVTTLHVHQVSIASLHLHQVRIQALDFTRLASPFSFLPSKQL